VPPDGQTVADTLLITGASGYLGSHLARQARPTWRIIATTFSHTLTLPGVGIVRLDIRDAEAVTALIDAVHPRAIIHTAFDMSSPEAMQSVIVEGTRNLALAVAASGAHMVHMSTDMVFDGERAPYSPGDPPQPITPYGCAKAEAEQIVASTLPRAAIVRTSLIYGFAPLDPRTTWVLDCLRRRMPITLFTDEVRSPVWVEQLSAALLELAERELPGIWHLAGPEPIDRYGFGVNLARAFGQDPTGITAGLSRNSGLLRPRDLTLDVASSQAALRAPLWGVEQVVAQLAPT